MSPAARTSRAQSAPPTRSTWRTSRSAGSWSAATPRSSASPIGVRSPARRSHTARSPATRTGGEIMWTLLLATLGLRRTIEYGAAIAVVLALIGFGLYERHKLIV